jgi:bifunctional non-homologous end joining protein LigD
VSGEQLPLPIDGGEETASGLPIRVDVMQPTDGDGPFDDADYLFEPWWPGLRTLLFHERGVIRLQSEQLTEPLAAFPELQSVAGQVLLDGTVIDGTLLVLDAESRPDPKLLRDRLTKPHERAGFPAFVASDLLYASGRPLLARPFGERRDRLGVALRDDDRAMVGRAYRGEGTTVARALASMGIEALSARHLGARHRAGAAEGAWLRLPVSPAPATDRRPSLTVIQRLPL